MIKEEHIGENPTMGEQEKKYTSRRQYHGSCNTHPPYHFHLFSWKVDFLYCVVQPWSSSL